MSLHRALSAAIIVLTAQVPRSFQATDYYHLTSVGDPQLAPDAHRVAFAVTTVVEDKDRRHAEIWMAATDGTASQFRYTSPAAEASSPVWSPDGKSLLYAWRGAEADSLTQQTWRSRVSPLAITRGPDLKRFDGRVYTSLPIVEDERGLVPPPET